MKKLSLLFVSLMVTRVALSVSFKIEERVIHLPEGWKLHQETKSDGVQLLGFEKGEKYLQLYLIPRENNHSGQFLDLSQTKLLRTETFKSSNALEWELKEVGFRNVKTQIALGSSDELEFIFVLREFPSASPAEIKEIVNGVRLLNRDDRSLTGPDFSGKKFYLGFGDHLSGSMGNEVKYDIAHTHDVFTAEAGGDYEGVKVCGSNQGKTELFKEWEALGKIMTEKDMFVQYSSGHGSKTGLAFGPSYKQIRDNALSYPAKEIIIFTMACYSGNLVDVFNEKKSVWQDWSQQGRTLMVMASSQPSQTSSTGPGKDPEEPGGPSGSAGSAFGHALWKALIGHSDGEVDGIKDRLLSIAEIRDFTKRKTKEVGGHTPVSTGAYNGNLLMAKVPSAEWLRKMDKGTSGLSDEQIIEKIKELDGHLGE